MHDVKITTKQDQTEFKVRKCAIYLRVSNATDDDKDFTSIDAQREACRAFIRTQPGWKYVDEYIDDGRSGKDLNRPQVQRLFDDIDSGKVDAVAVYKIDRISRSLRDFVNILQHFEAHDTAFASVTQSFSTNNPMGRFVLNLLMSFAEFEREMTVERTRDKIAATRRAGKFTGGPAPLGYQCVDGKLVVSETEAALVREIFETYLVTRSVTEVSEKLNQEKRETKARGKENHRASMWSKDMVSRVLRNPIYVGLIPHKRETFKGEHVAIVEPATFDKARAALAANAIVGTRHGRDTLYTLQGVARCACLTSAGTPCGHALTPGTSGKGDGKYRYYRCSEKEKGRNVCPSQPLPADALETFTVERLREIAAKGDVARELGAVARNLVDNDRPALAARAAEIPPRIADLSARGMRLAEQLSSAKPGASRIIESQINAIGEQITDMEREFGSIQERLTAIDAVASETGWIVDTLGSFGQAWDLLTPENKGRLVRGMVRSVDVDEPRNAIAITFAPLDSARTLLGNVGETLTAPAIVVRGELHRVRSRAVTFQGEAPPALPGPTQRPARVASMLALAHHVDAAIKAGTFVDLADVARRLDMTRARLTQVADLALLAPSIQAEILALVAVDGVEPLRERDLRPVIRAGLAWSAQMAAWERLRDAKKGEQVKPGPTSSGPTGDRGDGASGPRAGVGKVGPSPVRRGGTAPAAKRPEKRGAERRER